MNNFISLFFISGLLSIFINLLPVNTLDLSRGCPYSLLYTIPPSPKIVYSSYQWKPNKLNRYVLNEVVTYYAEYRDGLLPVLVCYKPAWKNINDVRSSIPEVIVKGVQATCVEVPCDAGHIIPSVLGGRDIITNIRPQDSGFNRGAWALYEKSINDSLVNYGDEIYVVVKFDYNYNNNYHEMKFIDKGVTVNGITVEAPIENLYLKQPTKYYSFTFSMIGSSIKIHSCGHYKNDRSTFPGTFKSFEDVIIAPGNNFPPENKTSCGV